jgi:hypothetical protein
MKIIGFSQLRNELSKGNLVNWFNCMQQCCDYIYIYDQNSVDGSKEYYKTQKNTIVIESPINDFQNEIICKKKLLDKLLDEHPDVDWIFWVDGDTLVDQRLLTNNGALLRHICGIGSENKMCAISMGHYNLWRSDIHYRVDSNYHDLHMKVVALWRNTENLQFVVEEGLHKCQYPLLDGNVGFIEFSLIHRGFATDRQIIQRYDLYKSYGQDGWMLDRLLDEQQLTVERLPYEMLPNCFELVDVQNPKTKNKIIDIYKEMK